MSSQKTMSSLVFPFFHGIPALNFVSTESETKRKAKLFINKCQNHDQMTFEHLFRLSLKQFRHFCFVCVHANIRFDPLFDYFSEIIFF